MSERSGNFTLSAPWWVLLVILSGSSGGLVSEIGPKIFGSKESLGALPAGFERKIDSLSRKVDLLSSRLGDVTRSISDLSDEDFGELAQISARMDRIASHLAAVDRRVRTIERQEP